MGQGKRGALHHLQAPSKYKELREIGSKKKQSARQVAYDLPASARFLAKTVVVLNSRAQRHQIEESG